MNELPTMAAMSYSSSSYVPNAAGLQFPEHQVFGMPAADELQKWAQQVNKPQQIQPKEMAQMSNARIVKVFIADPNENLPLDMRVLYAGEEKLTDLTDQELFFEVPINDLLKKHNEYRVTVVDKKQAEKFGRDIMLEPVRIKDLKMVVVTVAQF